MTHLGAGSSVGGRLAGPALTSWDLTTTGSLRALLTTHRLLVLPGPLRLDDGELGTLLMAITGTGPLVHGSHAAGLLAGPAEHRFFDRHRAFETLPDDVRDWLIGRQVRWSSNGLDGAPARTGPQPIFRRHPLNGQVALHLPPPGCAATISGLPDDVAAATILRLQEHAGREESLLHPALVQGDVVLWDSWSVSLGHVSARLRTAGRPV